MEKTYKKLVKGIKEYFKRSKTKRAVIGLSGGIDSSLCAKLVADAIGKENVHGIIMPVEGLSNEQNVKETIRFCEWAGISHSLIYLNEFIGHFNHLEWHQSRLAQMNTQSRIRAVILYNYANSKKALVIGTSNKTEIILGYFTKYGDGAVDVEIIGNLYKTDEIKLAKYLKLPNNIIDKTPTAELYHGQTDEQELGASYEVIDEILKAIENKKPLKALEKKHSKELVKHILDMIKNNEHKKKMPPTIRV